MKTLNLKWMHNNVDYGNRLKYNSKYAYPNTLSNNYDLTRYHINLKQLNKP